MKSNLTLIGAKGGGGSFRNTPDTLRSTDTFEALMGIGTGKIKGLAPGGLQNLFVNDVPMEDSSGNSNFQDFIASLFNGDPTILEPVVLSGGGSGGATTVNLAVNNSNQDNVTPGPWRVGAITTPGVDFIDLRFLVNSLYRQDKKGIYEETARIEVELLPSGSSTWVNPFQSLAAPTYSANGLTSPYQTGVYYYMLSKMWQNGNPNQWYDPNPGYLSITGKTTQVFVKELRISVPNTGTWANKTWQVRCRLKERDTYTQDTNEERRTIVWESIAGVSSDPIGGTEDWRGVSYLHIRGKASDQLNGIPSLRAILDLSEVSCPPSGVWNPTTRLYTGTAWDGITTQKAWTQCPAWQLKDLIEDPLAGIAAIAPGAQLNKWDVLEASKWYSQLVPNGKGGTHPRYSMNLFMDQPQSVTDLVQYYAGATGSYAFDVGNGKWRLVVDKPSNPVALFTKENILGEFSYSHTDIDTRYNDLTGVFKNEENNYEEDRVRVYNQTHIDLYGRKNEVIPLIGCTNRQEALRRLKIREIVSTKETRMVSFTTNRFGAMLDPFSIILVADGDLNSGGVRSTGRLVSKSANSVTLRDTLRLELGVTYQLNVTIPNPDYSPEPTTQPTTADWQKPTITVIRNVINNAGQRGDVTTIYLDSAFPASIDTNAVVALTATGLPSLPKQYRVLDVDPQDDEMVNISAIEVYTNKWAESDAITEDLVNSQVPYVVNNPPSSISFNLRSYESEYRNRRVLNVYWARPPGIWVDGFRARYKFNGGPWITLAPQTPDTFIEIPDPENGVYTIEVATWDKRTRLLSTTRTASYEVLEVPPATGVTITFGDLIDRPASGRLVGDRYVAVDLQPQTTYAWDGSVWLTESTFIQNATQLKYSSGQTVDSLKPSQAGADVTGANTALNIQDQGALAILNVADWRVNVSNRPSGVGTFLNPDSDMRDYTIWNLPANKLVSDGEGGFCIQSEVGVFTYSVNNNTTTAARFPVDLNQTYCVEGEFWQPNAGTGAAYLVVSLYDINGSLISGEGSFWYYPYDNRVPQGGVWNKASGVFGKNTSKPLPSSAAYATISCILNYTGTGTIMRFRKPRCYPYVGTTRWNPQLNRYDYTTHNDDIIRVGYQGTDYSSSIVTATPITGPVRVTGTIVGYTSTPAIIGLTTNPNAIDLTASIETDQAGTIRIRHNGTVVYTNNNYLGSGSDNRVSVEYDGLFIKFYANGVFLFSLQVGINQVFWGKIKTQSRNTGFKSVQYTNLSAVSIVGSNTFTSGGTSLSGSDLITIQGTAQYIQSQGALAIQNAASWATQVTGTGKPSDNAGTNFTWNEPGTTSYTVQGNKVTKTSLSGNWDYSIYSKESFIGTTFASGYLDTHDTFIGLTDDPTSGHYGKLNYSFHRSSTGEWYCYESGSPSLNLGPSYNSNTIWTITYDGIVVRYYAGSNLVRTVNTSAGRRFYAGVSIASTGSYVSGIQFGPYSENVWSSIGGTGRPQDGATKNEYYSGPSDPGFGDGGLWKDTSLNPPKFKMKFSGAWIDVSNLVTNTTQITDGAGLGQTAIWNSISGTGKPSDNAGTNFTLVEPGTNVYTIQGNKVTKTNSVTGTWDYSVYSQESFIGTAFISGYLSTYGTMLGLTDDPTSGDWTKLDYAFHFSVNGNWYIYESGSQVLNLGTGISVNAVWTILYDGVTVRYYIDGALLRTVNTTSGRRFYAGISSEVNTNVVSGIQFGPYSENVWSSIGGTGRPQDGATKNEYYSGPSDPGFGDGGLWKDTSLNPPKFKMKFSGAWIDVSNLVTNTTQITDGAGLGQTAIWNSISGGGKPEDNATRNNYYSGPTDPLFPDGGLWKDTSTTPPKFKMKYSGVWVDVSNLVTNTTQITDGAGLGQTAIWNSISGGGKPQDNADVTATSIPRLEAPFTLTYTASYTGVIKAGQLPSTIYCKRYVGNTDDTTNATWSITTNGCSATIGSTTGIIDLTAISAAGFIDVTCTKAGSTNMSHQIKINKIDDTVPVSGFYTGSDNSISNVTSSSYGTEQAGPILVQANSGGVANLYAPLGFNGLPTSGGVATNRIFGKWQYRLVGGSWADVASEIGTTSNYGVDSFDAQRLDEGGGFYVNYEGFIYVNQSISGLSVGSNYEFRLLLRRNAGTISTPFYGTASVVMS